MLRLVCVCSAVLLSASVARAQTITLGFTKTNVSCFGGSNGSITVTPSGGTPPYVYSWSPSGGTAATALGLAVGTYTVTVTDADSNTAQGSQTISQPMFLSASTVQQNVACWGGNTGGAILFPTGGVPPYSYSWSPSGGTASFATQLVAGSYTATITDANSCTTQVHFNITQPAAALTASKQFQINAACSGVATGSATMQVQGGTPAYTYAWSPSGGTGTTASSLAPGTYTFTAQDENGCTASAQVTITEPAPIVATPSQTNVSCNGGSNGTAQVGVSGGTPTYTYAWSPRGGSGPSAAGLSAGTYSVTITDANSCTKTAPFTITEPTALIASPLSQTNIACNGGATGSATVEAGGGTPGYTYAWAPSGGTAATASNLASGAYVVTVTDANSCTATHTFNLDQPPALVVTPSHTDAACHGASSGRASVSATGGTGAYTYNWSSGQSTSAIANVAAGTYTATVTDANSCTGQSSIVVGEPATALSVSVDSVTNVSCNGGSDGGGAVSASGGTPTYTYAWSPSGGTAATLSSQSAGTYTVTVTDAHSCTATNSVAVAEPDPIVVSLVSKTPDGCGDTASGSVNVSVSGGNGGYSYDWTPGDPTGDGTASISGLAVGQYNVTVDDSLGCIGSNDFDIVLEDDALPVAHDASLLVPQGGSVQVNLSVTYNGCTPLSYTVVSPPAHGTLDGTAPALVYHPDPSYSGTDGFGFQVSAGANTSAVAVVGIDVIATPSAPPPSTPGSPVQFPIANAMEIDTTVGQPVSFILSGSDPNGAALTYMVQTPPQFGRLVGEAPLLSYLPAGASAYDDQLSFIVRNGEWSSAPAVVTIHVGDATTPPADTTGCAATTPGELGLLVALLLTRRAFRMRR